MLAELSRSADSYTPFRRASRQGRSIIAALNLVSIIQPFSRWGLGVLVEMVMSEAVIDRIHVEIGRRGLDVWLSQQYGVLVGRHSNGSRRVECPFHRPGHAKSAVVTRRSNGNYTFMCWVGCTEKPVDIIDLTVMTGDAANRAEAIKHLQALLF